LLIHFIEELRVLLDQSLETISIEDCSSAVGLRHDRKVRSTAQKSGYVTEHFSLFQKLNENIFARSDSLEELTVSLADEKYVVTVLSLLHQKLVWLVSGQLEMLHDGGYHPFEQRNRIKNVIEFKYYNLCLDLGR